MEEGGLYASTYEDAGADGCEVWSREANRLLYFAEGYMGEGFHEYICVGDTFAEEERAAVTCFFQEGETWTRVIYVPTNSRATVCVNEDAGPDYQLSIGIDSDRPLVVERPMYFSYKGFWSVGHDGAGYSWG